MENLLHVTLESLGSSTQGRTKFLEVAFGLFFRVLLAQDPCPRVFEGALADLLLQPFGEYRRRRDQFTPIKGADFSIEPSEELGTTPRASWPTWTAGSNSAPTCTSTRKCN
jgi:hypothetical protein